MTAFAQQKSNKPLVACVSMTGTTAKVAHALANATNGELYGIGSEKRYTNADLNRRNEQSRCYVDDYDLKFRPSLNRKKVNIVGYDSIRQWLEK